MSSVKRIRHISQTLDENPHYRNRYSSVGQREQPTHLQMTYSSPPIAISRQHSQTHQSASRQYSHQIPPRQPSHQSVSRVQSSPHQHLSTSEPHHHHHHAHHEIIGEASSKQSISVLPAPPAPPLPPIPPAPPSCCSWRCCCRAFIGVFVSIGFIMAVAGIVLVLRCRAIVIDRLVNEMVLVNGSAAFKMFTNPPANFLWKFYFFNLTNADDVASKGARPIFREIGPYTYRIEDRRENIQLSEDESELSYTRRQFYYFDQQESFDMMTMLPFQEKDTLVQLDFVGYGGLTGAINRGMAPMAEVLLKSFNRGSPFRTHTIGDVLWGAKDPLFTLFMGAAAVGAGGAPPKTAPELFGLMYGRNGSIVANYTVSTGRGNIQQLQQLKILNGKVRRYEDMWPTENVTDMYGKPFDANVFRGVTAGAFPPDVTKDSKLTAFNPVICFPMDLAYWTIDNIGELEMLRFGVNYSLFNKLTGELNQAMCSEADRYDNERCAQNGVLNATKCFGDLPVILSWPHFLEADHYLDYVRGVKPNENLHAPFIDVDPLTGSTLRAFERIQVNFAVRAQPFAGYGNLPKFTMFPVVWMEQKGEITSSGIESLKENVYNKYNSLRSLAYALLIVSVVLVPVSVIVFFIYQCRENGGRCFRV